MGIIQEITETIKWLEVNVTSQNLVEKLQRTESLAIKTYTLASAVAEAYQARNDAEYLYKTSLSSAVALNDGAVAKTEAKAKHDYKHIYEQQVKADNQYKRLSLLLSQANLVVEQMRQGLSHLKKEYYHVQERGQG